MEPRISVVTLGVSDLPRSIRFYRDGLGWPSGVNDGEDVAFFQLGGGTVLSLFGREDLAKDANVAAGEPAMFGGFTLAQCLASKAEVDVALEAARAAGGTIIKPASDAFWGGYNGYFADPDGHPWEIAWNPFWELLPDGSVKLP
ncbi:MAG: VOC family protein [Chloroflexota bacterium]